MRRFVRVISLYAPKHRLSEIGLNKKSLERAIFSFKQTEGGESYFSNISGMFDSCRYRFVEGKVYGKFFEDGCYNDKFVEEL